MALKLRIFIACILLSFGLPAAAQHIQTVRITDSPKIDGIEDDAEWQEVPTAFDGPFIQRAPENLKPSAFRTEIKLAYDDNAFYVLAHMYDPEPGKVPRELGLRDQWGKNADLFAFTIDTYNRGQNAFYFGVTTAGVQLDTYMLPSGNDNAWDAVWKSAVTFTENGWVAEFEIPYSAIRFPKKDVQTWGINFIRRVQSVNEESTWSPVDNSISGFVNQSGELMGMQNVLPPLRLQLFPYLSALTKHSGETGDLTSVFGGGMDIKYGLNESFTLDVSLIPDFSQVPSDNIVLNLGPFEVKYNENRPFFTEGTDLFNKGGLFYSRRVGSVFNTFKAGEKMYDGEEIERAPQDAQLLNATKLSGRNKKGLGVGFFNAVTDKTFLVVKDEITSEEREIQMDPVTNFNVLVLDQNLKNNSNISLINTNVSRFEGGRDANVTATEFRLHDKSNTYRLEGFGAYNFIRPSAVSEETSSSDGFKYSLSAGKVSGKVQYRLSRNVESDDYDINDLGFMRAPNEVSHSGHIGYYIFQPFWIFNRLNVKAKFSHSTLYEPKEFTNFSLGGDYRFQFRNFWHLGGWYGVKPVNSYDYFEPRTEGWYFARQASYDSGIWMETDGRKRLSVYSQYGWFRREAWEAKDFWFTLRPRFRVSNSFSVSHNLSVSQSDNSRGFVEKHENEGTQIVFGNRDINVLENTSNLDFVFNNKMGLSLRARHYWSKVAYDRFFYLNKNGTLSEAANYDGRDESGKEVHQSNFNAVNIDLIYNWQIAPGSFVTFAWKDALKESNKDVAMGYGENMRALSRANQVNTFSLKLTYFVDYPMLKQLL